MLILELIQFVSQKFRKSAEVVPQSLSNSPISGKRQLVEKNGVLYEYRKNGQLLAIMPTNSIPTFQAFLMANPGLHHKFLLKSITRAVNENLAAIDVCRIGNTPVVSRIEKDSYKRHIDQMQKHFVETEEYELAGKCEQLFTKMKVNDLLDSC